MQIQLSVLCENGATLPGDDQELVDSAAHMWAGAVTFVLEPSWATIKQRLVESVEQFVEACSTFMRAEQVIADASNGGGGGGGGDSESKAGGGATSPGGAGSPLSPGVNIGCVSMEDEAVQAVLRQLVEAVDGNTAGPDALLERFRKYEYLYSRAELERVATFVARGSEFTLRELREELEKFDNLIREVRACRAQACAVRR